MNKSTPKQQILNGQEVSQKFFEFSHQDKNEPAQWWFQQSEEGLVLFVVFYTMACRWNLCTACNLPSMCSLETITFDHVMTQVDRLFEQKEIRERRGEIHKVIVSNNGSVLDEVTFPSTSLMYLLAQCNRHLPEMRILCMESRVEYVDADELAFIARALSEREKVAELEVAIGFEAFDDDTRNNVFKKGLALPEFEKMVAMLGRFNYNVKCYFMLKPVNEFSDTEAVEDIHKAIDWLHELSLRHKVDINMHLNPTYVAKGTELEKEFNAGEYEPPKLLDVARAALEAKGKNISVFLGLYDEDLAVPGGSFIREGDEPLVEQLERFNQTQDYEILEQVVKG